MYEELRKDYYLVSGKKFGSEFLAYKGNPEEVHAEALVFTKGTIVLASRMSTIARKKCLYVNPTTLTLY